MKWSIPLFVLVLALILVMPVKAATTVVVVAKPLYGIQPPYNLAAEYADDYSIRLTWSTGESSTQTMIRASSSGYPDDTEDGRLVYLGPAEEVTDDSIGVTFGETMYYRAWGEDAGEYSVNYDETSTRGETVFVLGMLLLTCAIIGLAFWKEDWFLHIVSSIVAIGFGAWWISSNSGFIYVIEGVVVVAIGIYMIYSTAISMLRR